MLYAVLLLFSLIPCISEASKGTTGLPLPRFASLKSNEVNLHVGPGHQYPVEWKYLRKNLPVEIIAEFDTWRKIRDYQGTEGWVHQNLLIGHRYVITTTQQQSRETQQKLHASPDTTSKVIAFLEPGVIAKVSQCRQEWCKIEVKGHKGWIKRRSIWGTYPHETAF